MKINIPDFASEGLARRKYDPTDETDLIRAIEENKSSTLVYYATLALAKHGTKNALAVLQRGLFFPKADVKITSLFAISEILREDGGNFYLELLTDKRYPEKWAVVFAIQKFGDANCCGAIKKRLIFILNKRRAQIERISDGKTEVTLCLDILLKHHALTNELKSQVESKLDHLNDIERSWLANNWAP